jgi:hypothetical protein
MQGAVRGSASHGIGEYFGQAFSGRDSNRGQHEDPNGHRASRRARQVLRVLGAQHLKPIRHQQVPTPNGTRAKR